VHKSDYSEISSHLYGREHHSILENPHLRITTPFQVLYYCSGMSCKSMTTGGPKSAPQPVLSGRLQKDGITGARKPPAKLRGLKIFAPRPQRRPLFRPRKEAATGMLRIFCLYLEMVDSRHTSSSPTYNSQIDVLELYCLGHVLAYCGVLVCFQR
jgi:hypothetical protein